LGQPHVSRRRETACQPPVAQSACQPPAGNRMSAAGLRQPHVSRRSKPHVSRRFTSIRMAAGGVWGCVAASQGRTISEATSYSLTAE